MQLVVFCSRLVYCAKHVLFVFKFVLTHNSFILEFFKQNLNICLLYLKYRFFGLLTVKCFMI